MCTLHDLRVLLNSAEKSLSISDLGFSLLQSVLLPIILTDWYLQQGVTTHSVRRSFDYSLLFRFFCRLCSSSRIEDLLDYA
jgi:hypothetical protein